MIPRLFYCFFLGAVPIYALMLWLPAAKRFPATLTVCTAGCDYTTIQAAIDAATPGDTIQIAAQTFSETLTISKTLTLQGLGNTVVDGGQAGSVVWIAPKVTATLQTLTLTNGLAYYGGGVENFGTAVLQSVVISGNTAVYEGGGVDNFGGRLSIVDSIIQYNTAESGGGITSDTVFTLSHSLVAHNRAATAGGGVYNYGQGAVLETAVSHNLVTGLGGGGGIFNEGALTLQNSTLSSNSTYEGGGLFNSYLLTITTSSVVSNSAVYGAGVYNEGSAVLLTSNILSNTATLSGGGVWNTDMLLAEQSTLAANRADLTGGGIGNIGSLTLRNVTISSNLGGDGGGVYQAGTAVFANNLTLANNFAINGSGFYNAGGPITLQNSLLAGNGLCFGAVVSNGYNLASDNSCNLTAVGDHNNLYPQLGPLGDYGGPTLTHFLWPTSPAINAANPALPGSKNTACETADQRGTPRPLGPTCDIGAYETRVLQVYLPLVLR